MRCPSCNQENRAERRFCAECGAALAAACGACGVTNEPGEKFCALAPVYAAFPEGFDTRDLNDAKKLLDKLQQR